MIQETYWGYIEWFHTPRDDNEVMNIGITVVFPNQVIPEHTHYGTEQFLYILEGEGYYIINGERKDFKAGSFFYLDADSTHETHNTTNQPVRELLVSTPVHYNANIFDAKATGKDNIFKDAVMALYSQSLSNLKVPFTILDNKNNIIIQNNFFSDYCKYECNYNTGESECLKTLKHSLVRNEFTCNNGIVYYSYPIQYENVYLGAVIGGHILISESSSKGDPQIYDTPKSTAMSIEKLLMQIARNITNSYEFNISKQELIEKDKTIDVSKKKEQELENSVTNLKINRHFLFNILNSMADIALQEEVEDLYHSIISLSKIFRYTMSSELRIIPLKDEIQYLNDYLNLQKLRYKDMLKISYNIADNVSNILVPFNFLQPIVENAFTHGLTHYNNIKNIGIIISKQDDRLLFEITNNGEKINLRKIRAIKNNMKVKTDHGLSFIYDKLQQVYEDNFDLDIVSDDEKTTVIISVPIESEV